MASSVRPITALTSPRLSRSATVGGGLQCLAAVGQRQFGLLLYPQLPAERVVVRRVAWFPPLGRTQILN